MPKAESLTWNFTLHELTRSAEAVRFGIDNTAPPEVVRALRFTALAVLEPVRQKWGLVRVSSGYRSPALNKRIKGSPKSQHMAGQAVDFEVPGTPNKTVAAWIRDHLNFDQLILEFWSADDPASGWIHCSYVGSKINRKSVLTASRGEGGRVVYTEGLPR